MLSIIEDCSPYYIRFTHDGIQDIINICLSSVVDANFDRPFTHYRFDVNTANKILRMVPFSKDIEFNQNRVSLFVSQPGLYYRAHKDGLTNRFSINYTVKILDDKCITSWYDDEDLKKYNIDNLLSRECENFVKNNHIPLKSMIAKHGECILFNTDIFHDWDNTSSSNERVILTLRENRPGKLYFEDIKKILFIDMDRIQDSP
jgi:hypothetical protein